MLGYHPLPGADTPPAADPPPGADPPGAVYAGRYGNKRAVSILLECILVICIGVGVGPSKHTIILVGYSKLVLILFTNTNTRIQTIPQKITSLPPANEVLGKVMFLHLSVSHSVHREGCLALGLGFVHPLGHPRHTLPLGDTPTPKQ